MINVLNIPLEKKFRDYGGGVIILQDLNDGDRYYENADGWYSYSTEPVRYTEKGWMAFMYNTVIIYNRKQSVELHFDKYE